MKLFSKFDAVKFSEENLIFVTNNGYLYYIYNEKYQRWRKHRNAGNDSIKVCNYPDVSRDELSAAMGGKFPCKETDFMRLCSPSELCIRDMLDLLKEDYPRYMTDWTIHNTIHHFLLESNICYKSFQAVEEVLDNAVALHTDNAKVICTIKELSMRVIGRDIFKNEIGIVDGHDGSSYFWIMPVRVIDKSNSDSIDSVAEMRSNEISIEEDDVYRYLTPFLYKYFDDELEANKQRVESCWVDDDGTEHKSYVTGFEWYLTYNFFTFDSIRNIINDIRNTIEALSSGRNTEYTTAIKVTDNSELCDMVIDFYERFIYRLEYMMKVGQEKGYNLISFMGP